MELLLCALLTIFPDYLFRRYVQGKQLTIFSVWHELKWSITLCVILTVSLIATIFYVHPATDEATLFFRTVPILPEINGRVAEIYVDVSGPVTQGAPIFRLDSTKQSAAVETARRKLAEIEAAIAVAQADVEKAKGQLREAEGSLKQAQDELATKEELQARTPGNVAFREIEKLQVLVQSTQGGVAAATAAKQAAEMRVSAVLPAERATADAEFAQAQVDLDKTVVRSGVNGRVEQFFLRVGDVVNPLMRPAGILIPEGAGQQGLQAGFGQIEAQVMKVGMTAEAACTSKPWTIIPMVVTGVQDYIAAGQFRGGERLIDPQEVIKPGTILVFLEPLYKGGLDGVTPGTSCIANAYSSNHDLIESKDTGAIKRILLHTLDAIALVHALILRLRALVLPFKVLVFSGH